MRSADLHAIELPASVKAIGRAGAGTNNIPVALMSKRGVPVFNAPGANANAGKELVLAGLLLAARNIAPALDFVRKLDGDDRAMHEAVEAGKKKFVGMELPGRSLGVVGLGAIGVKLANAAIELGMEVWGYDPAMTVQNAWKLDARVKQALTVDELLARSQFVSLHVPLLPATRNLVNAERIRLLKPRGVVLNFAREGIVDEAAVVEALNENRLHAYVCDFPSNTLKGNPRVVALPHLGASTNEAEDNCAVMVVDQLRDYLEHGNVRNAVNFPEAVAARESAWRVAIANANVPNMLGQISTAMARGGLNIRNMLNRSRGDMAYTLVDVDSEVGAEVLASLAAIEGVLAVRYLPSAA